MNVLKQGTRIKTIVGDIEAIIIGVCIRGNNVEYNIRWFANAELKDEWVFDFEFKVMAKKRTVGFGFKEIDDDEIPMIELK